MTIELKLTATINDNNPIFKEFLEGEGIDLQHVKPEDVQLMINEFGEATGGSVTIIPNTKG